MYPKKLVVMHLLQMGVYRLMDDCVGIDEEKEEIKSLVPGLEITDEMIEQVIKSADDSSTDKLLDSWLQDGKFEVSTGNEIERPSGSDMKDFYEAIEQIVIFADGIRDKYLEEPGKGKDIMVYKSAVRGFQTEIMDYTKKIGFPELCGRVLAANPDKKLEIQRRAIAVTGEGKHLEDSLLR